MKWVYSRVSSSTKHIKYRTTLVLQKKASPITSFNFIKKKERKKIKKKKEKRKELVKYVTL